MEFGDDLEPGILVSTDCLSIGLSDVEPDVIAAERQRNGRPCHDRRRQAAVECRPGDS